MAPLNSDLQLPGRERQKDPLSGTAFQTQRLHGRTRWPLCRRPRAGAPGPRGTRGGTEGPKSPGSTPAVWKLLSQVRLAKPRGQGSLRGPRVCRLLPEEQGGSRGVGGHESRARPWHGAGRPRGRRGPSTRTAASRGSGALFPSGVQQTRARARGIHRARGRDEAGPGTWAHGWQTPQPGREALASPRARLLLCPAQDGLCPRTLQLRRGHPGVTGFSRLAGGA